MGNKKYTEKEIETILNKAKLPRWLSLRQLIKVSYWLMFNRKRLNTFCWGLERGMAVHWAFKEAED